MKKLIPIALVLLAVVVALNQHGTFRLTDRGIAVATSNDTDQILASAFENGRSNVQVEGEGEVTRILPDDFDGSKHQRFIIRLHSGQTLLLAHNIDLARRVDGIHVGDIVQFKGEYEWNPEGGVIHWTHHDPAAQHTPGWIKHRGKTYQ